MRPMTIQVVTVEDMWRLLGRFTFGPAPIYGVERPEGSGY
jgi:hypothetical protein